MYPGQKTAEELATMQQVTEERFNNRTMRSNLHRIKGQWVRANNWTPIVWVKRPETREV